MSELDIWGMNDQREPVTAEDHAITLIQEAINAHISARLGIAGCGDHDPDTLFTIRHLHLAEPWLPACDAMKAMKAAGLVVRMQDDQ